MSEATARTYIGHAVAVLNSENLPPRDQALIFASLAQAEATLEVVSLLRNGLRLPHGEELTSALEHLANRLPDR